MIQVIGNNDSLLYIKIDGIWHRILTTELEITTSFNKSEYQISGAVYERSYIGQGSFSGSFKTPWTIKSENESEIIVTKYLEKLLTPEHQSQLMGHELKLITKDPTNKNKNYREVEFTATLSPDEGLVASDLNEQSYLSFEIGLMGDIKISLGVEKNEVKYLRINTEKNIETINGNVLNVKNFGFTLTDENSDVVSLNNSLLVIIFKLNNNLVKGLIYGDKDTAIKDVPEANIAAKLSLFDIKKSFDNFSWLEEINFASNVNKKQLKLQAWIVSYEKDGRKTKKELQLIGKSKTSNEFIGYTPFVN